MVFQIFLAKNFDSLKNKLKDCKNVFWKNRKKENSIYLEEIFVYSLCDRFYKINKENIEEFIMTFKMFFYYSYFLYILTIHKKNLLWI